jgi:hypothetical protein
MFGGKNMKKVNEEPKLSYSYAKLANKDIFRVWNVLDKKGVKQVRLQLGEGLITIPQDELQKVVVLLESFLKGVELK